MNHEYPLWTYLALHLFTKIINGSKSARIDFSTGTSFSKFWPILTYLDRVTHTQKCSIWGKKIYFQFFYSPSILYRLIKCPFPEKLVSQNSLQNKDSEKTIKSRSNRRRKAKGKKRAGEKDRYRFVRDVQILASMNAPKRLLNYCTSSLAVLCCKSLFQSFPYHANWLACISGVHFSGERMQARTEWGTPLRVISGHSGAECNKTMVRGQDVVFSSSFPSRLSGAHSLRACHR